MDVLPFGCRVRVDRIGRDCKLEISNILLMVDPGEALHRVECGCTVTSLRVRCGYTIWSFIALGECGLSLSLRIRPMKTHSSDQEMKRN